MSIYSDLDISIISLNDKLKMEEWDNFVESHPAGSPNHMGGWLHTIQSTYGFIPELFCIKNLRGKIVAIIPIFKIRKFFQQVRIISLPFSDYGGPLLGQHNKGADIVNKILIDKTEKGNCIELRGQMDKESEFVCYNYYKRHLLDLQKDPSKIKKCINKRTIQYSIKKAEKAGIVVSESRDENGIQEFMRLNAITRKKHGVPSQPKKWFENLKKNVIDTGKGFILLATLNSKVIGASIFLTCGSTLHYKYNASDLSSLHSLSPNHLLTWTAIKWGIEHNYKTFDFGRTAPDNKGLMRYKTMWGAKITDLPYYYYPKIQGATSIKEKTIAFRLLTWTWKHMPDKITEKISEIIFKQLA